jgi:hypothetical protein
MDDEVPTTGPWKKSGVPRLQVFSLNKSPSFLLMRVLSFSYNCTYSHSESVFSLSERSMGS